MLITKSLNTREMSPLNWEISPPQAFLVPGGRAVRIGVGTLNPTKIAAARFVFESALPAVEIIPVAVSSQVSDQPLSDEETVQGAKNRATAAKRFVGADLGLGLEGGISQRPFGVFTSEWAAIEDTTGHLWFGGGANLPIPPVILKQIEAGYELGDIIDQLTELENSKQGPGTIGILTHGLMNRRESYIAVITYALAPLLNQALYSNPIVVG